MSVLDFVDSEIPTETPLSESDTAIICESCGNSFEHTGRGRKPKRCLNCRANRAPSSGSSRTKGASNADVTAALSVMESIYSTVSVGLLFASPKAAIQWAEKIEQLQASNRLAFTSDKALCRSVVRLGERSGKGMFIAAHAMAILPVAGTLVADLRSRRVERIEPETEPQETAQMFQQPPAKDNLGFFG